MSNVEEEEQEEHIEATHMALKHPHVLRERLSPACTEFQAEPRHVNTPHSCVIQQEDLT